MSDQAPDQPDEPDAATADDEPELEPALYLVATPIGNLEDVSARALRILGAVDTIACEDTRHTRKLLNRYDIKVGRMIACHDHNEHNSANGIADLIGRGERVALCTDAGTPSISDPGYRVVGAVRQAGHQVIAIPGPSSVTTALIVSGLPTDRYLFAGFPPRKPGKRLRWLRELADHECTVVLFEAAPRLAKTLEAATEAFDDAQAAVCIELTKRFEETATGRLSELAERFTEPVRGEITLVIGRRPEVVEETEPPFPPIRR